MQVDLLTAVHGRKKLKNPSGWLNSLAKFDQLAIGVLK